ncbi:NAD(P)-binding domain-containing protein, partial [Streptosporangium saharense]|uniref:NAD(P)-binding domain-containing protein n=1 Tax=Streptosporangium saharense TaxID=1706840 RepID=UPI0033262778
MRIGIVGAGSMAEALGGGWVRAGHDVLVGGRDAGRTAALVGERQRRRVPQTGLTPDL